MFAGHTISMSLIVASGLLAWIASWLVSRHARALRLVQVPNHRSSHVQPTPHGGGIGIALAGSLGGGVIAVAMQWPLAWAMVGFALLIAVVGLWDDIVHLPAAWRFAIQCATCGGLLWILGGLPGAYGHAVSWPAGHAISWPAAWLLALTLWGAGVWWINLFNFMDGIDGIAGSQALFMLLGAVAIAMMSEHADGDFPARLWMLVLAAATLGFLVLNWAPARIFMGDVGSTYLAFMLFAFGLLSIRNGWMNYAEWLILGAVFITDATVTLLRRIIAGARWSQAHRSHAYQRLSRRWNSHRRVCLLSIGVNLAWVFPWACMAHRWPQWAALHSAAAYIPLIVGAWMLGAGRQD